MNELLKERIIEQYMKSEPGAIYYAMLIIDSYIFIDENYFSTFEKALEGAFDGKQTVKGMIRNDESINFRIKKKYVDSNNYISARITQNGKILEIWEECS